MTGPVFPDLVYRMAAYVFWAITVVAGLCFLAVLVWLVLSFIGVVVIALALVSAPFLIVGLVSGIANDRRMFRNFLLILLPALIIAGTALWYRHHQHAGSPAAEGSF